TDSKTVSVDDASSVVTYNNGQSKKYGVNTFLPGIQEKVFSQEFTSKDRVYWRVVLPNGKVKIVDADINSNHCRSVLNIIPYYTPPPGGKVNKSKIGAELTSLYETYIFDPDNFSGVSDNIFQLSGIEVLIEVVSESGQYADMISSLNSMGFRLVTEDLAIYRATGWFEISKLLQLNDLNPLNYARPVYPGVGNYTVPATGLVNSQGDYAIHADFARLGYDVDGSGIKIGVLSNSYNSKLKAAEDIGNGDLPGIGNLNGYVTEVEVLKDVTPAYGTLSDEGRAMLQLVHDIAPGASLAFRTGYLGEKDMADGVEELALAGCDIIVDDISYLTEPFFRDGVISKAIDRVVGDGVTFFSSAGNFGNYSYSGVFNPASSPSTIKGKAHDFGGGDIFQLISLEEGTYTLVLQWD
ncbi:MAG: hypothetical protein KAS29_04695, partial [Bacteroidales bacterium]|nr:hypothetical protein [Bacteroidales bacterium]